MGRLLRYGLVVAAIALCIPAERLRADTVDQFTYMAGGNTFQWELPVPVPIALSTDGLLFAVTTDFAENGTVLSGTIFFFNLGDQGGLEIDTLTNTLASALGDQVYTGSESAPTFVPGTFTNLIDEVADPSNPFAPATLTISEVQVAPVPEPSSLVLLGSSLLVIGLGLAIKKASN